MASPDTTEPILPILITLEIFVPKLTLIFALLLIALGVGGFLPQGSRTALVPAYVGGVLLVLGLLAMAFDAARKHLMHAASVIALLGALAPAATLVIRAAQMSPLALTVNVGMLALCGTLLILQIRSFIAERRARITAH
ncbi:MAG: hypothetical protein ACJASY_002670 [Halioglobus sp.]|jgi:hypothetical protein